MFRGVLAVLMLIPLSEVRAASNREVHVTVPVANVRAQPSTSGRVLFQVKAGESLTLLETTGDWYHVEAEGGRRGYLFKKLGQERTPPSSSTTSPGPQAVAPSDAALTIGHEAVECVVAGKHTRIEARFAPQERVARARTFFRAHDGSVWYYVDMQVAGDVFVGVLPRARKDTKRIDYYVQALDRTFDESRTQEYAPEVVADAGVCSNRTVAAFLPSARVIVGAPAGAPAVPAGFEAVGLVTGAESAAAEAPAKESSGGLGKRALLIGGGAAAIGLVAVAAGGGGGDGSDAPAGPSFANARFNPTSVTCTSTQRQNGSFVANILVDATNPSAQALTINSASDVLTFTAAAPQSGNSVGESIQQANVRFSPSQVAANSSATLQFQAPLAFRFPSSCSSFSGSSQLSAELTIVTSSGTFRVQANNSFSLIYP
jgi:hypothetical protein